VIGPKCAEEKLEEVFLEGNIFFVIFGIAVDKNLGPAVLPVEERFQ
jgi:hypothetical protein